MLTSNPASDDGPTAALVGGRSRRRGHPPANIGRSGQSPFGAPLGVSVPYHDDRGDGVLWAWGLDILECAIWVLAWYGGRSRRQLVALSPREGRESGGGGIGRYDGSPSGILAEDVRAGMSIPKEVFDVYIDYWDNPAWSGVVHWQKA